MNKILQTNEERLHNIENTAYLTDVGNAKRLVELFRDRIRYVSKWNTWMVYNGKRWVKDVGDLFISQFAEITVCDIRREGMTCIDVEEQVKIVNHANKSESDAKIKAMINRAKSRPQIIANPEEFDKDIWLFNCDNGTIDLRTRELKPHNPLDMITNISPISYDPRAKCERWIKFINETFLGDAEVITYIKRRLGYGLSGDTSIEAFDIFYGIGNNGKSKLMDEYVYVLGMYYKKVNVATIQKSRMPSSGNAHSSDVARLVGARVVWISEPSQGWELDEGKIKDFTGNDPITARHMFEREFQFSPQFKLFIIANYRPRILTVSKSVWRRLRIIPFNNIIQEGQENLHLGAELCEESSGILNWLLAGCLEYCLGDNRPPECITEAIGEYKEDMDRLVGFFELYCEQGNIDDQAYVTDNKYLYLVYKVWSKRQGEKYPLSIRAFPEALLERGIHRHPKRGIHGVRWCGIRLKRQFIDAIKEWESLSDDEIMEIIDGLAVKLSRAYKPRACSYKRNESSNRQLSNTIINKPISKDTINDKNKDNLIVNKPSITVNNRQYKIIEYLKQTYDKLPRPKDIQELKMLRNLMERELDEQFELDEEASQKYINDYFRYCGWE